MEPRLLANPRPPPYLAEARRLCASGRPRTMHAATFTAFICVAACFDLAHGGDAGVGSVQRHFRGREALNLTELGRQDHCNIITGGECFIFNCDDSRGGEDKVECTNGYCLCKEGFCAVKGECIKAPSKDNTDKLWTILHRPIRSQLEPNQCLQATALNSTKVMMGMCGPNPLTFELPIGPVGQLKALNMCLQLTWPFGVDRTVDTNKPDLTIEFCDINDRRQQFQVPLGGFGAIRSDYDRTLCLQGLRISGLLPPGAPEPPLNGVGWRVCGDDFPVLEQHFGMSEEQPPPDMPCPSQAACAKLKMLSGKAYCQHATGSPYCQAMLRCPPGGCSNGSCYKGVCMCNVGFDGPTCQDVVPGPQPLNAPVGGMSGAPTPAAVVFGMPAPAPAPGPAGAPGPAPGAAPAPAMAPAPGR